MASFTLPPHTTPFLSLPLLPFALSPSPLFSYHLQALRHLYVLAAEKRILVPIDVDSHDGCYVPVELEFKSDPSYLGPTKFQFMAPCMLPDLNLLRKVTIKVKRRFGFCVRLG